METFGCERVVFSFIISYSRKSLVIVLQSFYKKLTLLSQSLFYNPFYTKFYSVNVTIFNLDQNPLKNYCFDIVLKLN